MCRTLICGIGQIDKHGVRPLDPFRARLACPTAEAWSTDQMRPPLFRRLLCAMQCIANIPLALRRRVPHGCTPGSSPLPWPSLSLTSSAPSGSRCRANISALPCDLRIAIHFMLRAAVLLSFLRRILRFSTTGHPGALGACYVASWQLPRLDSHQLADDSFQGTSASC